MSRNNPIEIITKTGRRIEIREMDDSYVFAGDIGCKPGRCTSSGPIDPASAVPDPAFENYQREAMHRYGQSAVLAWDERKIIGFVTFHPINASFDNLCPGRNIELVQNELCNFKWPAEPSKKLRILCVSVAPDYQRQGIGSKMVEAVTHWAPSWGYTRVHVGANDKSWWTPAKPFYDKLGFEVVEIISINPPPQGGDDKVFVMEKDV